MTVLRSTRALHSFKDPFEEIQEGSFPIDRAVLLSAGPSVDSLRKANQSNPFVILLSVNLLNDLPGGGGG